MLKVVLVSVLAACASAGTQAPAGHVATPPAEPFVPVPTDEQTTARCHARPGNGLVLDGDTLDAPVIVLEEIHLHGHGPSSPRSAIFEDGRVLFERGHDRQMATLPQARVYELQRTVLNEIADEPRGVTRTDFDGGTITDIVVRDGETWHVVDVYGANEDEFLETAAGKPRALDSDTIPTEGAFHFQPQPLPRDVAIAYRTLLQLYGRYRGERTIDAVEACARKVDHDSSHD